MRKRLLRTIGILAAAVAVSAGAIVYTAFAYPQANFYPTTGWGNYPAYLSSSSTACIPTSWGHSSVSNVYDDGSGNHYVNYADVYGGSANAPNVVWKLMWVYNTAGGQTYFYSAPWAHSFAYDWMNWAQDWFSVPPGHAVVVDTQFGLLYGGGCNSGSQQVFWR